VFDSNGDDDDYNDNDNDADAAAADDDDDDDDDGDDDDDAESTLQNVDYNVELHHSSSTRDSTKITKSSVTHN